MFNENLWLFVHNFISKNLNRKIIVFGTGSGAMKTVAILGAFTKDILYFVDNYPKTESFYGKNVNNPEVLKTFVKKPIVLVASERYKEIFSQLIDYGYNLKEDFICTIKLINTNEESDNSTRDYTLENRVNGVRIGRFSYGYEKHCFRGTILQEVGSFCSINDSSKIGEGNHPYHLVTTHPFLYQKKDTTVGNEKVKGLEIEQELLFNIDEWNKNSKIIIGNDVWIGANAVVLPGVSIGDGAVIGAGAVVTKDVEPYAIMGGVPAKLIKYRFSQQEIELLLKLKWWNWPLEKIRENINLFIKPEEFYEKFGSEVND